MLYYSSYTFIRALNLSNKRFDRYIEKAIIASFWDMHASLALPCMSWHQKSNSHLLCIAMCIAIDS